MDDNKKHLDNNIQLTEENIQEKSEEEIKIKIGKYLKNIQSTKPIILKEKSVDKKLNVDKKLCADKELSFDEKLEIQELKQAMNDKKNRVIGVIGKFGSGKSSLINTVLKDRKDKIIISFSRTELNIENVMEYIVNSLPINKKRIYIRKFVEYFSVSFIFSLIFYIVLLILENIFKISLSKFSLGFGILNIIFSIVFGMAFAIVFCIKGGIVKKLEVTNIFKIELNDKENSNEINQFEKELAIRIASYKGIIVIEDLDRFIRNTSDDIKVVDALVNVFVKYGNSKSQLILSIQKSLSQCLEKEFDYVFFKGNISQELVLEEVCKTLIQLPHGEKTKNFSNIFSYVCQQLKDRRKINLFINLVNKNLTIADGILDESRIKAIVFYAYCEVKFETEIEEYIFAKTVEQYTNYTEYKRQYENSEDNEFEDAQKLDSYYISMMDSDSPEVKKIKEEIVIGLENEFITKESFFYGVYLNANANIIAKVIVKNNVYTPWDMKGIDVDQLLNDLARESIPFLRNQEIIKFLVNKQDVVSKSYLRLILKSLKGEDIRKMASNISKMGQEIGNYLFEEKCVSNDLVIRIPKMWERREDWRFFGPKETINLSEFGPYYLQRSASQYINLIKRVTGIQNIQIVIKEKRVKFSNYRDTYNNLCRVSEINMDFLEQYTRELFRELESKENTLNSLAMEKIVEIYLNPEFENTEELSEVISWLIENQGAQVLGKTRNFEFGEPAIEKRVLDLFSLEKPEVNDILVETYFPRIHKAIEEGAIQILIEGESETVLKHLVKFNYLEADGDEKFTLKQEQEINKNKITVVTRRDIFDILFEELDEYRHYDYQGRSDEITILSSVYNLDELPSTDSRFKTAKQDIYQHTVFNDDWPNDWILKYPFFDFMNMPDAEFLKFICKIFHPEVRVEGWEMYFYKFAELLKVDGYELYSSEKISGKDVFGWRYNK